MSKEDKFKEVIGVVGVTVDPYEVAAFESEEGKLGDSRGKHRMVFLMKSGQKVKSAWMDERCERSWRQKLQLLFDYIHPGKMAEWAEAHGFEGYLKKQGVETKEMKQAKEKNENKRRFFKR